MQRALFAAVIFLIAANSQSLAARCKGWERQPNGSQVRSCVGDLGKSYCETCNSSGCTQVKCPESESHPPSFYNPKQPPKPRPPS